MGLRSRASLSHLPLEDAVEIDACCDAFEAQWNSGPPPRIADFLTRAKPELVKPLLLELIGLDRDIRLRRGEPSLDYRQHLGSIGQELHSAFESRSAQDTPTVENLTQRSLSGATEDDDAQASWIGRQVGQYRIVGILGQGGMGTVYRAEHTLIRRTVALKMLRSRLASTPAAIMRFYLEAEACMRLLHPNIVRVHDVGQDSDQSVYMTMELIEGRTLADVVKQDGPMPPQRAGRIIRQIAEALAYAAVQVPPIVHRDIKPQNIMLTPDEQAKLLDLGLARVLGEEMPLDDIQDQSGEEEVSVLASRLTGSGAMVGTVAYMAPEQVKDPRTVDGRADIYSLGCTLFYLLSGQHAFKGDDVHDTLRNVLAGRRSPLEAVMASGTDGALNGVVDRMLARRREERYASCKELIADLDALLYTKVEFAGNDIRNLSMEEFRDKLIAIGLLTQADWDRVVGSMPVAARERRWRGRSSRVPIKYEVEKSDAPEPTFAPTEDENSSYGPTAAESQDDSLIDEIIQRRGAWKIPPQIDPIIDLSQAPRDPASALIKLMVNELTEFQVQAIIDGHLDRLRVGDRIITDRIASSWKGETFRARNPLANNRIEAVRAFGMWALEGLDGDHDARRRQFLEIAMTYHAVEHPHLGASYQVGTTPDGIGYWASEFISDPSLSETFSRAAKDAASGLSTLNVLLLGRDIAQALSALHDVGLMHGDVSPWTIRVPQGGAKLVGAGVRRLVAPNHGRAASLSNGVLAGAAGFMAPEIFLNPEDMSLPADIYGLGAALYFALSGELPYLGKEATRDAQRLHIRYLKSRRPLFGESKWPEPAELLELLKRMLAIDPDDRTMTASEVATRLSEIADALPDQATSASHLAPTAKPKKKWWKFGGK